MSNVNLGTSVKSLYLGQKIATYTGVIIHTGLSANGKEINYSAGNSSGYVLEVDNPFGTQQMAYAILASLKLRSVNYQPFEADKALSDPAAEIGDSVTANGKSGIIMSIETDLTPLMASDLSAPLDEELGHEFQYEPKSTREFKRESAYTRARLTINQDEIRAEVVRASNAETILSASLSVQADRITAEVARATNSENTLSSRITQTADAITSEVTRATGAEGQLSTQIAQRLDSITLSVSSSAGSSTFAIRDGSTTLDTQTLDLSVKSANISGTLTIGQLESAVQNKINGAVKRSSLIYYSKAASGAPTAPSSWVSTTAASQETWTQTRPEYSQSYAYLYIARQTETEDGTYSCTTPTRDYTTTVIDGANIITGSITANKISVTDLSALGATIGGWTIEGGAYSRLSKETTTNRVRIQAYQNAASSNHAFSVATRATANDSFENQFYVTYGGKMYAKNAEIEGKVTATSGVIGGVTIANGTLSGITDTNITAGGITGSHSIAAGSISGGSSGEIGSSTITTTNTISGINTNLGYAADYGGAIVQNANGPTYFNAYDIRARHAITQAGYGFTRETKTVRNSAGTGTVTLNYWSWGS